MRKKLFLLMTLAALMTPLLLPKATLLAALQESQTGTIRGTVVREGTSDPIPEVQITVIARGNSIAVGTAGQTVEMTSQLAQQVLAAARGNTGIPPELLQAAQALGAATPAGQRAAVAAPLTATSDHEGHFTIKDVPVGNQIVRAQLDGYFGRAINGSYPSVVTANATVAGQEVTDVRLAMIPGGTLNGRVFDNNGKPLADTPVYSMRSGYENGLMTLQPFSSKTTNDRGEYRLYRLPPGEYYLAASPRGSRGSVGANPPDQLVTTLYPNLIDASMAAPITVRGGDEFSGIDIQMKTAPVATISGKVVSLLPPGTVVTARGAVRSATPAVFLTPRGTGFLPSMTSLGAASATDDGAFEIPNVPPGAYDIYVRLPAAYGWGPQNPPERAEGASGVGRTAVEVRGANVQGVNVIVRPGAELKGRLVVDGKPSAANLRVTLEPDDSAYNVPDGQLSGMLNQISLYAPRMGDDGSFSIPALPEGHYRFQVTLNAAPSIGRRQAPAATNAPVTGPVNAPANVLPAAPVLPPLPALPATSYLADIRQGGQSVYDNGLTIGTEAPNSIEVLVNTNGGHIEGIVNGADQKPVANVTVVVIPPANRRQNPALYRTARSDAQGRFKMTNLPPGAYKVFAWENVAPGAYQNAEFLRGVEDRGVSATVTAGATATVAVQVIPDDTARR